MPLDRSQHIFHPVSAHHGYDRFEFGLFVDQIPKWVFEHQGLAIFAVKLNEYA